MIFECEGHQVSIIPNENSRRYTITEFYNGQEVSFRRETKERAEKLAKKYKDLGYDSF
jgi:hypothetical protein